MRDVTARQLAVLRVIEHHRRTKGYPPTIREIGDALRIASTNGVVDHLRGLERRGLLTRGQADARSAVPTKAGLNHLNSVDWPLDAAGLFDATTVRSGTTDPLRAWWVLRRGSLLAEGPTATEAIQRAVQLWGVQR